MSKKELYQPEYYQKRRELTQRSASKIVSLLYSVNSWQSVVDFGCADGTWLSVFAKGGASDILGIDGPWVDRKELRIPQESFVTCDFSSEPVDIDRRFDLACCIEVIEHVPDEAARRLHQSIVSSASAVLFSAAVPYQGGAGHVNERRQSYWVAAFRERGFVCVDLIRQSLWDDVEVNVIYRQNMFLYVHEKETALIEKFSHALVSAPYQTDLIHPDLYEQRMSHATKQSRSVPGVIRGVHRRVRNLLTPKE